MNDDIMELCEYCYGRGGRYDDEIEDQWYWCQHCDASKRYYERVRAMKRDDPSKGVVGGFFLGWDNSEPPRLWVWKGDPGDETAEAWIQIPLK